MTPTTEPDAPQPESPQPEGQISYEEARDQLVEVVRTLEQGGTNLAESLALWERGEELAGICQAALDGARARLDEVLDDDGPDGPDAG